MFDNHNVFMIMNYEYLYFWKNTLFYRNCCVSKKQNLLKKSVKFSGESEKNILRICLTWLIRHLIVPYDLFKCNARFFDPQTMFSWKTLQITIDLRSKELKLVERKIHQFFGTFYFGDHLNLARTTRMLK